MSRKQCSINRECTILVKGNVVSFDMEDGRTITLPKSWGLAHDPKSACSHKCDMFVTRYTIRRIRNAALPSSVSEEAQEYFGEDEELYDATVDIPRGPWKLVGRVVQINYDRLGEDSRPYYHPFDEPVPLYRQSRGRSYKLALPRSCIVNARGFVSP